MTPTLHTAKLIEILKRYPVAACYIFGSYARNDMGPLSDIDVGILLKPGLSSQEEYNAHLSLAADVEEAVGGARGRADILILNSAGVSLAYRVIQEGKLLYENDEAARTAFEYRTMQQYFDRQFYFDRHALISLKAFAAQGLQ